MTKVNRFAAYAALNMAGLVGGMMIGSDIVVGIMFIALNIHVAAMTLISKGE